jgi:hypothetical protein
MKKDLNEGVFIFVECPCCGTIVRTYPGHKLYPKDQTQLRLDLHPEVSDEEE